MDIKQPKFVSPLCASVNSFRDKSVDISEKVKLCKTCMDYGTCLLHVLVSDLPVKDEDIYAGMTAKDREKLAERINNRLGPNRNEKNS